MSNATIETCTKTNLLGAVPPNQILDGETVSCDENNIVTLTLRFLRKEAEIAGTPKKVPEFGGYTEFVLDSLSAEALNDSGGHFIVTAVYKTLYQVKGEGDYEGEFGVVETMDYNYSEEPLEAHPNIKALAKKYGGVPRSDGTYDFPATRPAAAEKGSGLSEFGGAGGDINPLYGMKTYPALQARFSKVFGTKDRWMKYVSDAGKIRDKIPDATLSDKGDFKGRNWLQLPPKLEKNGIFFRVQVEWLLSAPGKKWPEDVFEKAV
jgi:hypothetical protein